MSITPIAGNNINFKARFLENKNLKQIMADSRISGDTCKLAENLAKMGAGQELEVESYDRDQKTCVINNLSNGKQEVVDFGKSNNSPLDTMLRKLTVAPYLGRVSFFDINETDYTYNLLTNSKRHLDINS